jgi:hypothetical protein
MTKTAFAVSPFAIVFAFRSYAELGTKFLGTKFLGTKSLSASAVLKDKGRPQESSLKSFAFRVTKRFAVQNQISIEK